MADADPVIDSSASNRVDGESENKPKRKFGRIALMVIVPLLLIAGAAAYWFSLAGKVSTDNAYVQQDMVSVSSEVGGKIIETFVVEGDTVAAGDLLFRIDPEPYRLQIAQADAAIASAQANVIALSNSSALTGVDITAARQDIAFAQSRYDRVKALWDRGFSSKADYEAAQQSLQQARDALRQAEARQQEARARLATGPAVPGVNPQVAVAQAQRANAELSLARTEIRAPVAGRVAQADRLQVGQQAVPSLPVITLVEDRTTYVTANFKETDLADMRVGQRAKLEFDAYPGLVLEGHVESIGAGTGSEFSILPAQNATGNWVKVTQRVPVRIAIDSESPRTLIAGLSTYVTVFTEDKPKN